LAPP